MKIAYTMLSAELGGFPRLLARCRVESATPRSLPLPSRPLRRGNFFWVLDLVDAFQKGFWVTPPTKITQVRRLGLPCRDGFSADLDPDLTESIYLLHAGHPRPYYGHGESVIQPQLHPQSSSRRVI